MLDLRGQGVGVDRTHDVIVPHPQPVCWGGGTVLRWSGWSQVGQSRTGMLLFRIITGPVGLGAAKLLTMRASSTRPHGLVPAALPEVQRAIGLRPMPPFYQTRRIRFPPT